MEYSKHFIPLESDPRTFTELAHKLGVSDCLEFVDVLSLDDEVDTIPGPVLALILNLPSCPAYEREKAKQPTHIDHENEGLVWLKQTINNACGLYAILHSVCNVPGVISKRCTYFPNLLCMKLTCVEPGSTLDELIKARNRAEYISNSNRIEESYKEAVLSSWSEAPPADEVDHHYICIIKKSRRLFLLDGDMRGPIHRGQLLDDEDAWTEKGFNIIREYTESRKDGLFSLLALVNVVET
jgi:ubiquitin carboxyl-terminal hydrolase L3